MIMESNSSTQGPLFLLHLDAGRAHQRRVRCDLLTDIDVELLGREDLRLRAETRVALLYLRRLQGFDRFRMQPGDDVARRLRWHEHADPEIVGGVRHACFLCSGDIRKSRGALARSDRKRQQLATFHQWQRIDYGAEIITD